MTDHAVIALQWKIFHVLPAPVLLPYVACAFRRLQAVGRPQNVRRAGIPGFGKPPQSDLQKSLG